MTESTKPMKYVRLGTTGLKVSRICLGCMSYGSPKWANWVLEEEASLNMIKAAYDSGINFFDTANVYSNGESERVLGKAIKQFNFPREKIVVATKVYWYVHPTDFTYQPWYTAEELPNQHGLSRKHIFDAVDASLERLGLDYIDLYQIHRLDYHTPMEEIMEALHDVVKSGKVRYIGASSMWAWQFQKLQNIAEKHGWTKFVTMQNQYNLAYREEEREMNPYCLDSGVGLIPWSPLHRGLLSGKNRGTTREQTVYTFLMGPYTDVDSMIIDRVLEVAQKKGIPAAQVALAWLFSKPVVSAPIVGISKLSYLKDAVESVHVTLTEDEIKYLEEVYQPKAIDGHS